MKHIFRFILIYVFIACIGIVCTSFALNNARQTAYSDDLYRLADAFIVFFRTLPAILCTGFICGASRTFGEGNRNYRVRFSPSIMQAFRETMICGLFCVALVFIAHEAGLPLLMYARQNNVRRAEYLNEYIIAAETHLNSGEYFLAKQYAQKALEISARNSDASALLEKAEYRQATEQGTRVTGAITDRRGYIAPSVLPDEEEYSVTRLLEKAKTAFAQNNWFDAHYYAITAMELTAERDPNYAEAKRLSSEAWNYLAAPESFANRSETALFEKKRLGYRSLVDGDDLKAYYIFKELSETIPNDPDVTHYLQISTERTRYKYFFMDEVPNLDLFMNISNVHFSVENPDGGRQIINFRGVAPLEDSGRVVLFLRQLSVSKFNQYGNFEMSYFVPFAKMFAQSAADLDDRTRRDLGVRENMTIPCIMLEGIDYRSGGIALKPSFTFAGKYPTDEFTFSLLGIPYRDLLLLIDCSRANGITPLDQLLKFAPIADKYGFSKEVYLHDLYTRLAYPLAFFLLILVSAIIAWDFRMTASTYFKLLWILIPPVLTGMMYLIHEMIEFFVSVAIYAIIGATGNFAPFVLITCFIVFFIIISAVFMSHQTE
jgi:tetratricopeptide (TPR) repeat protein